MTVPVGHEHGVIKPEVYSSTSIALMERELILANLMWRWSEADFKGAREDTVNVKVPGSLTARNRKMRATGEDRKIKMDYLSETTIGVKLTEFPYSAVPVTDEQMTLDITDFGRYVLQPQTRALVENLEGQAASIIENATYEDGADTAGTDAATVKGTLAAEDYYGPGKLGAYQLFNRVRRNMNRRRIAADGRVVIIGTDLEEEILNSPQLVAADQAGDSNALRDATIGKLAGFTFITSQQIDPTSAYAFHSTAFVMATAAPIIPQGAVSGASVNADGFALRWLKDYDADYAVDRSILDCFSGTGVVKDKDVTVDPDTGAETVTEKFLRGIKITADIDQIQDLKLQAAGFESATVIP